MQAICEETVKAELSVDSVEPVITDVSYSEEMLGVSVAVNMPFAPDLPDKVKGLQNKNGKKVVHAWQVAELGIMKIYNATA